MITMERQYDTYGFRGVTLEEAASRVQQALDIQLKERDSGYYAGTYFLYRIASSREMRLYKNYDALRDGWVREQYRGYDVILEVSDMNGMEGIRQELVNGPPAAFLLASKVLPAESNDESEVDE